MAELLSAAQMRAIERAAIESGEVTGLELMERAGQGVVEAIFEEWPELRKTDHRAVVLCGPGNNGGDGFVVARLLKERGWEVEVFLYRDDRKLPADANVNRERWREMGEVRSSFDFNARTPIADVHVDALFGTGLTRTLAGEVARLVHDVLLGGPRKTVAIDGPSGLCLDSGRLLIEPAHPGPFADLTVTFHRGKSGQYLGAGPDRCGKLCVIDIGLDWLEGSLVRRMMADLPQAVHIFESIGIAPLGLGGTDQLSKYHDTHKYYYGHTLILSGGVGKGGAARLAARGALRIGAGVVTVGCPPGALQENAGALDAVMLRSVKGGDGLAEALQDERINALCLGPGLGVKRAAEMVAVALGSGGVKPRPTVLDADALTAVAGDTTLLEMLHENCVLTPHAGEFARLFPDISEKLNAPATKGPAYSKVDAAREAAARAGCVVLFKGPDTVIAAPDGRCAINSAIYERAAPWLATAGSGDVLAGFIAGLLARGFGPMQAAETGAWLHVECALKFGPGLIAEDLPEMVPTVFRDLGL